VSRRGRSSRSVARQSVLWLWSSSPTRLPARYRDPQTLTPYATLAAYHALRAMVDSQAFVWRLRRGNVAKRARSVSRRGRSSRSVARQSVLWLWSYATLAAYHALRAMVDSQAFVWSESLGAYTAAAKPRQCCQTCPLCEPAGSVQPQRSEAERPLAVVVEPTVPRSANAHALCDAGRLPRAPSHGRLASFRLVRVARSLHCESTMARSAW
jgi:hypothetical protein